jgi:hypothetical protein
MLAFKHFDRDPQSCEVIFQREGYDIETLYWAGSMAETQELARTIAFKGGADAFRIIEFVGDRRGVALHGRIATNRPETRLAPYSSTSSLPSTPPRRILKRRARQACAP